MTLRRGLCGERVAVVGVEVAAVPVALEDGRHLLDDVRVARAGDAQVPFEAGHLRRVGQVRRADVRRRVARVAVEQPGLGVQARDGRVVGDAHVGTEIAQRSDGRGFGGVRVGRRQHAERGAAWQRAAEGSKGGAIRCAGGMP